MNIISEALEQLDTDNLDDFDYYDEPDELDSISEEFAIDIQNLIKEFIENDLTEAFVSPKAANKHFNKHCIGNGNKKSCRQTVYYDFTKINDYINYENNISNKCTNADIIINSLYCTQKILNAFRELFRGNYTIRFSGSCGFSNNFGSINIAIHSYCTDYTTNYVNNTVDICILSRKMNTISLYPVDANYLESKFNNIVKKYSNNQNVSFHYNH